MRPARDTLRDSEAAADPVLECGHGEVGVAFGERRQRPAQICVAEEQRARRRRTLAGGEGFSLSGVG